MEPSRREGERVSVVGLRAAMEVSSVRRACWGGKGYFRE